MNATLLQNGLLVNEGSVKKGDILIIDDKIEAIQYANALANIELPANCRIIDANGLYILPGMIDMHVHFREPGGEHKATIRSESNAAIAGGITTVMDMPNTKPLTITREAFETKIAIANRDSKCNYMAYIGATNENLDVLCEVAQLDACCGIKVFLGSSTGNMLVEGQHTLEEIFKLPHLIAVHAESEPIIRENTRIYTERYAGNIPFTVHSDIRSEKACYESSKIAVELARKLNTQLHLLHVSTAKELELLDKLPCSQKHITAEAIVNHLWFTDADYTTLASKVKCNPAIKTLKDRNALRAAVESGLIDTIGTDHAPHTIEEKAKSYLECPSGMPSIQHSLLMMAELFSLPLIVEKMAHNPAIIAGLSNCGFLRQGYRADIVLLDPNKTCVVEPSQLRYKCAWSPMEGYTFKNSIAATFVNGEMRYVADNNLLKC